MWVFQIINPIDSLASGRFQYKHFCSNSFSFTMLLVLFFSYLRRKKFRFCQGNGGGFYPRFPKRRYSITIFISKVLQNIICGPLHHLFRVFFFAIFVVVVIPHLPPSPFVVLLLFLCVGWVACCSNMIEFNHAKELFNNDPL